MGGRMASPERELESPHPRRHGGGVASPERSAPQLAISLALDRDAPRAARKHVETVDRPSPDLRDAVVLLTSELISLAVRRCQFAGAAIDLRVWMPHDVVRVEIRAPRSFFNRLAQTQDRPAAAGPDRAPDYALVLIRSLADRWSLEGSGDVACMWFEIDRH
jgi:hypothetical protein